MIKKTLDSPNNKPNPPSKQVIEYHPNGKVKSKTTEKNGKKHTLHINWGENGYKDWEAMWNERGPHGPDTWWHENGEKWMQSTIKDGSTHGVDIEWYENGQKRRQTMRKDGKKHGLVTEWYKNGDKWEEIYYLRNKEYARIEWNKEGRVTKSNLPDLAPARPQTRETYIDKSEPLVKTMTRFGFPHSM